MKRCSACLVEFSPTPEYFHKSKRRKDGLHYDCKVCANAKKREQTRSYGVNPFPIRRKDGQKQCSSCEIWKPETVEFFSKSVNRPGGFDVYCKECCSNKWAENSDKNKAYRSRYYQDNKEQIRINDAEYRNRPEIKAIKRQKTADWRENNRDRDRANASRWQKNNPLKVKVRNETRRTRKQSLPATLTAIEWQTCLEYFNHACAVCGNPPGLWHTIAMDHWIPLSNPTCPGTTAGNCIPLCHGIGGCNNSKHDLMPDDWLIWKYGKRKAKAILDRINNYFRSITD
jgi:hypothetical protein